jgi:hypothetical protein
MGAARKGRKSLFSTIFENELHIHGRLHHSPQLSENRHIIGISH